MHILLKESVILNSNNLYGKFSFFLLKNAEIFYKIQIFKDHQNLLMKVLIGVFLKNQKKIERIEKKIINYVVNFIVVHLFEVLTFKDTKYKISSEKIIIEEESDNSDYKLNYE